MITEPEYHQHEEFRNRSQKPKSCARGNRPLPAPLLSERNGWGSQCSVRGQRGRPQRGCGTRKTERVIVAGRLILFRAMGKNAFAHLQDETGRIQIMFNRDTTQVEGFTPTAELNVHLNSSKRRSTSAISSALRGTFSVPKRENSPSSPKTRHPPLQNPPSLARQTQRPCR